MVHQSATLWHFAFGTEAGLLSSFCILQSVLRRPALAPKGLLLHSCAGPGLDVIAVANRQPSCLEVFAARPQPPPQQSESGLYGRGSLSGRASPRPGSTGTELGVLQTSIRNCGDELLTEGSRGILNGCRSGRVYLVCL